MANLPTIGSIGASLPSVKFPTMIAIVHMIADGKTPTQACRENGTSLAAFRHAMLIEPELKALFDDALETGSDVLAETLVDIHLEHTDPRVAKIISDNIKWLLERRKPDRYGQRVQVSMENNATRQLIEALDKAIDRIPSAAPPRLPKPIDDDVVVTYRDKKTPPALPQTAPVPPTEQELRELGLA